MACGSSSYSSSHTSGDGSCHGLKSFKCKQCQASRRDAWQNLQSAPQLETHDTFLGLPMRQPRMEKK